MQFPKYLLVAATIVLTWHLSYATCAWDTPTDQIGAANDVCGIAAGFAKWRGPDCLLKWKMYNIDLDDANDFATCYIDGSYAGGIAGPVNGGTVGPNNHQHLCPVTVTTCSILERLECNCSGGQGVGCLSTKKVLDDQEVCETDTGEL